MLWILKYKPNLAAQLLFVKSLRINIFPVKIDSSRGRFHQPVQMLHQGRFARARMTDQANKLSIWYDQTDIVQSPDCHRRIFSIYMTYFIQYNRHRPPPFLYRMHWSSASRNSRFVSTPFGMGNPSFASSCASNVTCGTSSRSSFSFSTSENTSLGVPCMATFP